MKETKINVRVHDGGVAPYHVEINNGSTYEYRTEEGALSFIAKSLFGDGVKVEVTTKDGGKK